MIQQPLITVGVTSYNAQDTIERAIRSAMAQTWQNLEILVVDDFSDDRSVQIIKSLILEDRRIRLVCHQKNMGCAEARNSIVTNAKGDFIAFFDDDDASLSDRVTLQYDRIIKFETEHNTQDVFCYTHRSVRSDAGETLNRSIGYTSRPPSGMDLFDYLFWHFAPANRSWGNIGSCTLMARTAVFQRISTVETQPLRASTWLGSRLVPEYLTKPFDARFRRCAEWDAALRLAFIGGFFISVDQPLVIQNITNTSDKAGRAPLKYALLLRKKYKYKIKQRGSYLASIACAYSRFYYAAQNQWASRAWQIIACVTAPRLCLLPLARRKLQKSA